MPAGQVAWFVQFGSLAVDVNFPFGQAKHARSSMDEPGRQPTICSPGLQIVQGIQFVCFGAAAYCPVGHVSHASDSVSWFIRSPDFPVGQDVHDAEGWLPQLLDLKIVCGPYSPLPQYVM